MTSDFKGLTKLTAIKEFSTIGNMQVVLLMLATSIIAAVYFRDKEDQLEIRLRDKKERVIYFKESLILLFIPVILASLAGFLIKSALFGINIETLAGSFEMPFYVVFNTTIYMLAIAGFGVSVGFLFQITMKTALTATLYPLFIFESLILIFGVSNLFASEKISGMVEFSNFTSSVVLNYLNMFTSNLRVEMLGTTVFFTTILALIAGSVVCLAGASRFIVTYKEETLTHNYRSTFLRRFIIVDLVTLFVMYLSMAGFGAYSMLNMNSITLDKAMEYSAIATIILVPLLTVLFEYLYIKRNEIVMRKRVKKEKKPRKKKENNNVQITENIENNGQNVDVNINIDVKINETSLESKGIVKETVKTSYTPKDDEELGENLKEEIEASRFETSIDDNEGFEELFFDEDITIKEKYALSEMGEDVKIHQNAELDNSFFETVEENKEK